MMETFLRVWVVPWREWQWLLGVREQARVEAAQYHAANQQQWDFSQQFPRWRA